MTKNFPDQLYGELQEGLHIAGYSLERAFGRLENLISGDAWKKCGPGFKDINTFLGGLQLDQFRPIAEERRRIAKRIKELQPAASNRAIAKTLGAHHETIASDIGENSPQGGKKNNKTNGSAGDNSPLTGAEAAKIVAKRQGLPEQKERRSEKLTEINSANKALPEGKKFSVIYADPPWRYEHPAIGATNRAIENHYPTMTLEEICSLEIESIAAENANLYLWATSPKLAECFEVIRSWGFEYRTDWIWDKEIIGMGYHVRDQHETLLIAKRGDIPAPDPQNRPPSIYKERRGKHSAKPAYFRDQLDLQYPELEKIELFARNMPPRDGWTFWGNQS